MLINMTYSYQFVCFGGSPKRMEKFAFYMVKELQFKLTAGQTLYDISHGSDRYVLYKVGPVISVSVSRRQAFLHLRSSLPSACRMMHAWSYNRHGFHTLSHVYLLSNHILV